MTLLPTPVAGGTPVQRGPDRHVRHPIDTALRLLSGGWSVARGGSVSVVGPCCSRTFTPASAGAA
ncbi:hypothetical protein [Deinococcus depolymerans]|uniref:Uncharacterized protein n=1 Tax=Deinococcus depolymerans TaxID=392408 RepID=A0ABP3MEF2_9DEIO